MPRNFVILYNAREASSAIIESLSLNPSINVPLFEQLDWYQQQEIPPAEIHHLVDRVFRWGDLNKALDKATAVPKGRSWEVRSQQAIGFKWRIWGESEDITNVFQKHEVVVFNLIREDLASYTVSTYMSDIVFPSSERGKLLGVKPGDQPQFVIRDMDSDSREEFRRWFNSLAVVGDVEEFCNIADNYVKSKEWAAENYLGVLRRAGIDIYTVSFEAFQRDSADFISTMSARIAVEAETVKDLDLKRVSHPDQASQITNYAKIVTSPRFQSILERYQSLLGRLRSMDSTSAPPRPVARRRITCPYTKMPSRSFWSKAVSDIALAEIDIADPAGFKIDRLTKLATAGSCFAQHIARYLSISGYNYFVTERGPEFIDRYDINIRKLYNYGVFSARFGNIYTIRQLRQLFDRAFGRFEPEDSYWEQGGRFIDPLRPHIQPNGFASLRELEADRAFHLSAVRRMFKELDVFVFTMGLTEAFCSQVDGAVYPVCPGCGAGVFDARLHQFVNFDYESIMEDMKYFLANLAVVNKAARVIITVSPVPLIATAEDRHVIQSTVYSKSVLRAVAGRVADIYENVSYFPSFDLIAGHASGGAYFEDDMRNVREDGVRHAMRMFFRHFCESELPASLGAPSAAAHAPSSEVVAQSSNVLPSKFAVICEEEYLDASRPSPLATLGDRS